MRFLKQSTSVDLPVGPFLDDTDGKTAETALTITQPDIRLKKNGAAWAQKNAAQTLSHEENGYYEVTLDTTDTDTLGQLRLNISESGALPVWEDFMVMPSGVWDTLFGASNLSVSVAAGGITSTSFGAGAIDAASLAADAVDELWDEVLEGSLTGRQVMRLLLSALAGKLAGAATTTITIRDNADSKNRISATVDSSGNRTAVTLDAT